MRKHLRRHLPDHESIRSHRWAALFGNTLLHPRLWHLNRHSAAGGVAVGLFCSMIPGPFQMLGAALLAVVFKVNLPLALVTTLVSNPLTIVPMYILAYNIGARLLSDTAPFSAPPEFVWPHFAAWIDTTFAWMLGLGKPLAVGLPILALLMAVAGYGVVLAAWRIYLIRAWRHRHSRGKPC